MSYQPPTPADGARQGIWGVEIPGPRWLLATVLVATVGMGLLALPTPFGGDQAEFAYGAKAIAAGDIYYVDFWDNKQPGIYLFFLSAGKLFGFSEYGVHALDLLWQLGLSIVAIWLLLQCVERPWVGFLAPLAIVAPYFAFAWLKHMTKVEALVSLPLALSLVAAYQTTRSERRLGWAYVLGVATGLVGLLKLLYLPLPTAFAVLAAVLLFSRGRLGGMRGGLKLLAGAIAGSATVWIPVTAYFWIHDALDEAVWTSFVYPTQTLAQVQLAPLGRLLDSAGWFLKAVWGFVPLALLGLTTLRRPRSPVMTLAILCWLLAAVPLLLVQKFSWWQYHFLLFLVPVGFFAVVGLDRLLSLLRGRSRWTSGAILFLLTALPLITLMQGVKPRVSSLARALQESTDMALPIRLDGAYRKYWGETHFLRSGVPKKETIYVFGDPRILWLSGWRTAIPESGWGWEMFVDEQWERLPSRLATAKPTHIFVSTFYRPLIEARAADLLEELENSYIISEHPSAYGSWFTRKSVEQDGSPD